MHLNFQRLFFLLFSAMLTTATLLAQPEGESPYSSSNVDAPPGDNFFNTYGLVIICGVIFFGLILFLVFRGRRRTT
ncbi:hypothetical protein [Neolewinella litorea]|uniref:Uncharacterized protein n=1 Tax=Neolewinella litorea TaxID=2562452 RepID=A0A4S4NTZ9_9BACT|nr:hypothetical protein [Neolewinella litorea]THH41948.1 hypothetical protein E4021_05015 [Neolewinella litorea]